ncbi:MAG: malate synthase A [Hyphomonadaceae bacterium]|nr:malate synthase A [Hyphomonadaceae bacterium]MBC6411419.1 malate synthase A [Hyphomonadaceae bacterium]
MNQLVPRQKVLAKVTRDLGVRYDEVLTPDALLFLADLERRFGPQRKTLLENRCLVQNRFDDGELPMQPPETAHIRNSMWEVSLIPTALRDRRVEITGPVDRKMVINALNSGAKMFMADFEDASSPTFANMIEGQINMMDYARGTLSLRTNEKNYVPDDETATMLVRPRGWHLIEKGIMVDGQPMSASLVDFGLHFFHNGKILAEDERGPFYYLPKMENYQEARLWNDIFSFAQAHVGLPNGTIKATVLIETLSAAFQMDEILYVLRHHVTGLNCGRWDYIFSYIKTLRNHRRFVLPDRARVGMDRDFLDACSTRLIEVCHKRRAHAMGGMAAQIPVRNDEDMNKAAFEKVRQDKLREVKAGYDGTWVAHPDLVPVAMEVFNEHMVGKHQILKKSQARRISDEAMLNPHSGKITESGIRMNISVGVTYIAAWLCGRGAVPIHNLMEDTATAEISRAQIWQWLRHKAAVNLADGTTTAMTASLFERFLSEELDALKKKMGRDAYMDGRFPEAAEIFEKTATSADFPDFLTLPAYDILEN